MTTMMNRHATAAVVLLLLSSPFALAFPGEQIVCGCASGCGINMTFQFRSGWPGAFCRRVTTVMRPPTGARPGLGPKPVKYYVCLHVTTMKRGQVLTIKHAAENMVINGRRVPSSVYTVRCPGDYPGPNSNGI